MIREGSFGLLAQLVHCLDVHAVAGGEYLEVLHGPGHLFHRQAASPVVVVNESTVRAFWPGESALGRRLQVFPGQPDAWATVVGVVADNHYRSFPEPRPAAWTSTHQYTAIPAGLFLVRTSVTGAPVRDIVAGTLAEIAPDVRVVTVHSMEELMRGPMLLPRFAAAVLAAFAVVTLLLTGLGVYGVFAVMVQERGPELGVRKALGARGHHLARLVVGRVLVVGLVGVVAGLALGSALGGSFSALLYGVELGDASVVTEVAAATLALALLAGGLPALRAIRTDPATVLRAD